MSVILKAEPKYNDCLYVARNLRERDQEEIYATKYNPNPETLAKEAVNSGAFRWCAYYEGRPVALIGALPRWPGVWSVWAYGTDEWSKVIVSLTRHVRRFMTPAIFNAGAHRVDACALASHTDARKWLRLLGANQEETLESWGKNGENFVCHVWTREKTKRLIDKIDSRQRNAHR